MQLITTHFHNIPESKSRIHLKIDRRKLAKRRFRATADDGTDFGFDLPHPLKHETPFYETDDSVYLIEQAPEPVLRIPIEDAEQAALYGWMVGNMHFPAAFEAGAILAEDDPAVRQMLERSNIAFEEATAVFQPPSNAAAHHHH
ncbi:urease accessory protein UreE [Pelagicoccus sp. NFK12]|uniref:Urease accessory protein UreE n=1 Tax=Pelagicoccus enzymogenes TaxID=2773457 RepID=A0A927IIY4_9BACT|nr:urease accessory protein UreE [Pelagicoccus enzymogenes]MBD5781741.1 urease accessory protein UreE [Pelagicoccus enzymogenes]